MKELNRGIDPSGPPDRYTDSPELHYYGSSGESAGDAELIVEIDVPEGASADDVLDLVGKLVLHADALHRSFGGHGLKVERLEVHQSTGVTEDVPRV